QISKPASSGLVLEQDSPQAYGNTQLPYLHPTASRMPSVTAMTSLVSSLPPSSTAGDRVLPIPALGRPQPSALTLTTPAVSAGESVPLNYYGLSQHQSVTYKPNQAWSSDNSPSSALTQGPTVPATLNSTGRLNTPMRKGSA